jgi:hypothetical protein
MKHKQDTRDKLWTELEADVQARFPQKDPKFILKGKWKKFYKNYHGFKVYAVNGEWIRNNLSVIYGHGGHAHVHEFIPKNEIWISTRHFKDCDCQKKSEKQPMSKAYFESTLLHEYIEYLEMKKGMKYWHAHQIAEHAEEKAGLLKELNVDL